jgi:hypothetical protein
VSATPSLQSPLRRAWLLRPPPTSSKGRLLDNNSVVCAPNVPSDDLGVRDCGSGPSLGVA